MLNRLFTFKNTFEVYKPVINGETVTWVKDRDEKGLVVPGALGLVSLVSENSMDVGDAVMNLTDIAGKHLFSRGGLPYRVYVTEATPQIDPDGYLLGWRHTLRRELPRNFNDELLAIAQSVADGFN